MSVISPNACKVCRSTGTMALTFTDTATRTVEHYVWCPSCDTEGPHRETPDEAKAAWDEQNPLRVHTVWVIEPHPSDGLERLTLAHILEDELDGWEEAEATTPAGKPVTIMVRKKGQPEARPTTRKKAAPGHPKAVSPIDRPQ